jgi:hypothetical protein
MVLKHLMQLSQRQRRKIINVEEAENNFVLSGIY